MKIDLTKVILFLALFYGPGATAQSPEIMTIIHPGTKLFVYAHDGLSLRSKPGVTSEILAVVKFGESIIVLPDQSGPVPFTSTGVPGIWIKVRSGEKTGYQFSGFLSRFPPMEYSKESRPPQDFEQWIQSNFPTKEKIEKAPDDGRTYNDYLKITLQNDGFYERSCPEGGCDVTLTLPLRVITYQEVFLIARLAYPEFFGENPCAFKPGHLTCDRENSSVKIDSKGGSYVLDYGFAD